MLAISPDMRMAALIRQDLGRPHVPHANNGRTFPIMAQTVAADVPMEMLREAEGITAKLYFGVERLIFAPDAPGYPAPPLAISDLADMARTLDRILSNHDALHRHGGAA